MKEIAGWLHLIDETTEDYLDEPYYELVDGRRVDIKHVFVADWKDFDHQHICVEKAAKDGKGYEVLSICAGDDNFHFCNESRTYLDIRRVDDEYC
jgi:hypothetical protein